MPPRIRHLAAPLALLAALSACSSGDGGTTNDQGAPPAGSSAVTLVAQGTAFDSSLLRAPEGTVEIRLDNQDNGVPHNLHVRGGEVDDKTEIESGPIVQTLTLTLVPGTYMFMCDVHPQQMSGEIRIG